MVLAGGLGTRIQKVLGDVPKVLAPIEGVAFVDRLLGWLARGGVTRAILCLGCHARAVVEHVERLRIPGLEIVTSVETSPLGTGGALGLAAAHVRAPTVLALNGDTFVDLDLGAFARHHRERGALATIACVHAPDRRTMGAIEVDGDDRVVAVREKDPRAGAGWASAGTYLVERRLLEEIPVANVSLEKIVLPSWVGRGFFAFRGVRRVHDIGTPEGLSTARDLWTEA